MDMLKKLSPMAQVVLGGSVLYLIFSFLDWQQACGGPPGFHVCAGRSEWNGVGVIAGLLVVALLVWEVLRLLDVKLQLGNFTPALISVALALALLVFTVITFFSHNEFRHWPQWLGLILSIVIAVAAFMRGKDEGVRMPDLGAMRSAMSSSSSSSADTTAPSAPSPPPAPEPPPASEPPPAGSSDPAA
jgi:hypothetical protein